MAKKLRAEAEPFSPANSEENRSLFLTFSNGSPLSWQEIAQHFDSVYGDGCVEYVYVHRSANENRTAEFGKIIFRRWETAKAILRDNKQVVRVLVNGKDLWLKKYIPPQERHSNTD